MIIDDDDDDRLRPRHTVRHMAQRALVRRGGARYLARCAVRNPAAFPVLLARVAPLQAQDGAGDGRPLIVGIKEFIFPENIFPPVI